jgi:hypothetical protein
MNDSPVLVLTAPADKTIPLLAELRQMAMIVVGHPVQAFANAAVDAEIILNWSGSLDLLRNVFLISHRLRRIHSRSAGLDSTLFPELIESDGAETGEVPHKDAAAEQWCDNATTLTGTKWTYLKVQQKAFETLQPTRIEHLEALRPAAKLFENNRT